MNTDEIKRYLEEYLRLDLSTNNDGMDSHYLEVGIFLDGECVAQDTISLSELKDE